MGASRRVSCAVSNDCVAVEAHRHDEQHGLVAHDLQALAVGAGVRIGGTRGVRGDDDKSVASVTRNTHISRLEPLMNMPPAMAQKMSAQVMYASSMALTLACSFCSSLRTS